MSENANAATTSSDPEIEQLVSEFRSIIKKAHRLSGELNSTVDELEAYVKMRERRWHDVPFSGEDRRGR